MLSLDSHAFRDFAESGLPRIYKLVTMAGGYDSLAKTGP